MVLTWAVLVVAMQVDVADAGVAPGAREQRAEARAPLAPVATATPAPVEPVAAAAPLEVRSAAARLKNAIGVGFFGATQRTETAGPAGERLVTVSTPFIGVRWWTPLGLGPNGRLGLEVAGGISLFTNEIEGASGLAVETQQGPTRRGFGLQAAVPFALAGGEHAIVSVAPEFRYVVSDTVSPTPAPLVETGPSRRPGTSVSDLALRGGVELFFGFIGVPNLSLELDARLVLRWAEVRSVGFNNSLLLARSFGVTSSISDDPFAVLVSSIAAKYYF